MHSNIEQISEVFMHCGSWLFTNIFLGYEQGIVLGLSPVFPLIVYIGLAKVIIFSALSMISVR